MDNETSKQQDIESQLMNSALEIIGDIHSITAFNINNCAYKVIVKQLEIFQKVRDLLEYE